MAFAKSPAQMNLVSDHPKNVSRCLNTGPSRLTNLYCYATAWLCMGLGNAEVTDHLITVSLALATMAASSSSVISMARLNWVVSVVLKVAGRRRAHRSPV